MWSLFSLFFYFDELRLCFLAELPPGDPKIIRTSGYSPPLCRPLLCLGFFTVAATVFGSLDYIYSVTAYVEAVKQVEIPVSYFGDDPGFFDPRVRGILWNDSTSKLIESICC